MLNDLDAPPARRIPLVAAATLMLLGLASLGVAAPEIPEGLRGGVSADQETIDFALTMQAQGWEYMMPRPKSPQAGWGNTDGRTTWWVGFWINRDTNQTSATRPQLTEGKYVGDGQGAETWRRGGSPAPPTVLEWLLSKQGGFAPVGAKASGATPKVEPKPGSKSAQQATTVYITKSGGKYHQAGCRYLSKSKISILLQDAHARGYTPCSVCRPPR